MPVIGLRHTFELTTRNSYTKLNAEIGLSLDGRELPNTAVLGDALDEAVQLIQDKITASYKEVPARDGTTPSPAPKVVPQPTQPVHEQHEAEPLVADAPKVPDF